MQMPPTVFLIDDDDTFYQTLVRLVSSVGLRTERQASGKTFLQTFDCNHPGCVLIDLGKPHLEGMHVLESLAPIPLRPPVIGLVDQADVKVVVRAARQGAAALLQPRHTSHTELLEAIQAAVAQDQQQRANFARGEAIRGRFDLLNASEWQVLELLLHGHDLTYIADKLAVSRRTVDNRRLRLMQKLQVTTFAGLVALLIEKGHFPDPAAGQ